MTMNNNSFHNEKLISLIMENLKENTSQSKVKTVYHTIFNNTILPVLRDLPCNKVPRNEKQHQYNVAMALKMLRKHLPYNLACFCSRNPNSDSLYHAINDFKYYINSYFHELFYYK